MFETGIYIATDSRSPKATEKHYGYVLECTVAGTLKTREGFGKTTGTYHQAVLMALAEALGRFTKPCGVTVYTEDTFILNMIAHNLQRWKENGFQTGKGEPVANQEEWRRIQELLERHAVRTAPGKHSYTGWLQGEIQKRKEQEDV